MSTDLPPPDVSLVLVRVTIESLIDVLPAKKRERFLREMANRLTVEERFADVVRIRPASQDAELAQARREAMIWFRQTLPAFMARL